MPLVVKDRVRETTTTLGTGTITLAGAVAGFQSFSAIGNANTTYYTINLPGANEWEVGIGTYTASGTTLSRDTVLASSNSGNLVSFSAGTKDVFCTYPAGRSVYYDTATNVSIAGTLTTSLDASIYGITVGRGAGAVSTNTAVGGSALAGNTSGLEQVAVGYDALFTNQTGSYNTAVGLGALKLNVSGSNNTAVGYLTLLQNTASNNTAVGYQAGYSNQTGIDLVAVGYQAANNVVSGSGNVAIGAEALQGVTTGTDNVAIGRFAMEAKSTSSSFNVSIGYASQVAAGIATSNTSVGYSSLRLNQTGSNNVAIGSNSLYNNTTASSNTVVGHEAGYSNQTGAGNFFGGYQAGFASVGTTGIGYNTALGYLSGTALTTGYNNTFVGSSSGSAVISGIKNTIIGGYSGNQGGLDIRTASNYIVLSDGDGNPRQYSDGSGSWTIPASLNVNANLTAGSAVTYPQYSQSFSLGTTQWIRLCRLGNPGTMRIRYFLGSGNSEEYGEVYINTTYVAAQQQIQVSTQSYNNHLLEVRLVSLDGYPTDVFFLIRSDSLAPSIAWTAFDVRSNNGLAIYNDTTTPGAATASLSIPYNGTGVKLTATNGIFGAFGGGVQFPATQNASSNANTLDDYERGTWTPSVASTGGATFTYGATTGGTYIKIGRWMYLMGVMNVATKSGGSSGDSLAIILPINAGASDVSGAGVGYHISAATCTNLTVPSGYSGFPQGGVCTPNQASFYPFWTDGANNRILQLGDIANGFTIQFSIAVFTNT